MSTPDELVEEEVKGRKDEVFQRFCDGFTKDQLLLHIKNTWSLEKIVEMMKEYDQEWYKDVQVEFNRWLESGGGQ